MLRVPEDLHLYYTKTRSDKDGLQMDYLFVYMTIVNYGGTVA